MTPEHLQSMVDEYFESCFGPVVMKDGSLLRDDQGNLVKIQRKPFALSALALYIGVSTQSLKNYRDGQLDTILDEMKAETSDTLTFSQVVKNAKQRIEAFAEERLYDRDGQRGAQFVLDCCYGWVGRKDEADIARSKADSKIRQEEFELKKRILDQGDEDGNLTINIIRGKQNDS